MNIWEKIKASLGKLGASLSRFMVGRYGVDKLSTTLMWTAIILLVIATFTGASLLSAVSMILYGIVVYRMFSRDRERRAAENRKFTAQVQGLRTKYSQAKVRFKNRKVYKYVRCPKCHTLTRIPRGAGSVSVRCKPCGHVFSEKA